MTKLLYFDDSYQFHSAARVKSVHQNEDGQWTLILGQTIFYPQGGGQPCDQGVIFTKEAAFQVEAVRFYDNEVHHIGHFTSGIIEKEEAVQLKIDPARRRLNARLHSAGHLIDLALDEIEWLQLSPNKGFHFPEGPYVEYEGSIAPELYESTKEKLELILAQKVKSGGRVSTQLQAGNHSSGKPLRTVQFPGGKPMPCGGTHVKDLIEIGPIQIRKIKSKKGKTKIAYSLHSSS